MADDVTSACPRVTGWTLGRLAGIEIRMHVTFLVLVLLALLGLLGPPAEGLVWIAVVFTSVVLHELGHSIVARRRGLVVLDIVLLPVGGASEIEGLGDRPRDELVVAGAGPLTSVVLAAAVAGAVVLGGGHLGAPTIETGPLAVRVVWVNLALAAFNLVPALPMDGGRVLRAGLAARVGIDAATVTAARVSRRIAIAMAVIGVVWVPWLLVIAAFVYVSGRAEEMATMAHRRLRGLVVRDAMVPVADPTLSLGDVVVREEESLEEAIKTLAGTDADAVAVVDDRGAVVGILLARRVAELLGRAA